MRRRVWHNLVQLDALMSFQMALPSMIPTEFCDTKVPRNLQYSDLEMAMASLPPGRPGIIVLGHRCIHDLSGLYRDQTLHILFWHPCRGTFGKQLRRRLQPNVALYPKQRVWQQKFSK